MKNIKILLSAVLLLAFGFGHAQIKVFTVLEALRLKKVSINKVNVSGLGGNNVHMEMMNLSNEALNIYLEPGLIIDPAMTEFQSLLLTDSLMLVMKPSVLSNAHFAAFCTEPSDMGPRNIAKYNTLKMGSEDLRQLAVLIGKLGILNRQSLVWDYVNRVGTYSIQIRRKVEGFRNEIGSFIKQRQPNAVIDFVLLEDEKEWVPREVVSIASDLGFMHDQPQILSFKIFTEAGELYKTVFENKNYPPGTHLIQFGFSAFYPKITRFKAQLIKPNGEVFKEVIVDEATPYMIRDVYQINYNYEFLTKQVLKDAAIVVSLPNGEKLMTLKKYAELKNAYHQVAINFNHYYDPKSEFILELIDADGKVYDRTEFDAFRNTKKLFKEW